jgi:hypothetical protein
MAEGVSHIASTDDRRLIEDYLPIQATCLRATRRQVSADLPAACLPDRQAPSGSAAQAGASREKSVRAGHISTSHWWWTTRYRRAAANDWSKAQQLGEHYWLCGVWDPLVQSPELVSIQNPVQKLDHAKREIIASRYYEIPADSIR